jgi:hypothetical protein
MPGAAEWKARSIYQVLTDRFATSGPTDPDPDIDISNRPYCGGTWQGIIEKLDYIQGMGFDAVWISPVSKLELDDWSRGSLRMLMSVLDRSRRILRRIPFGGLLIMGIGRRISILLIRILGLRGI